MIQMLWDVLVEVPETYLDYKTTDKGKRMYVENRTNNVVNTIRHGIVRSVPIMYKHIIEVGDDIYFHHNIVRTVKDWHGNMKNKMFAFDPSENLYRCPLTEVFAIVRGCEFKAVAPTCFIKPIKEADETKVGNIYRINIEEEKTHYGIVKYGNEELEAKGIHEGDKVIFKTDSEYTYHIFGEKLYRMKTSQVLALVKEEEWTGEKNLSNNRSKP